MTEPRTFMGIVVAKRFVPARLPDGLCGYAWDALVNFTSPHQCVEREGHSGPHRCRCMAHPGDDSGTPRT